MNFIILAHQRTGTHLLATALNSHPNIYCTGETREAPSENMNNISAVGRIIMYNQLYGQFDETKKSKIIHLTRNPRDTAMSNIANLGDAVFPSHKAHFYKKEKPRYCSIDKCHIDKKTEEIGGYMVSVRKALKSINHLEITYEELTNGKSIKKLPKKPAKKILDFLGVKYKTLTTNLVKSPYKIKCST